VLNIRERGGRRKRKPNMSSTWALQPPACTPLTGPPVRTTIAPISSGFMWSLGA